MKRMPLAAARRLFDGLVIAMLVCAVLFTLSNNFFLGCAVILLGLAATAFHFAVLRCPHCGKSVCFFCMTVKKISDLLFCHSSAVILYYEDQLSFTYVSADPDFSCLPFDVDPVKKSILHKRLKDQSWNIAPVLSLIHI